MRRPTCQRCGDELPAVEVTTIGEAEPRWAPTVECDCPGPRCPICHTRIDTTTRTTSPGECPNTECVLWTVIIPIPEMA